MTESTGKRPYARGTLEERFWSKVIKTETCWIWDGAHNGQGYGRLLVEGSKRVYPHRFSYELVHGPIPEGMQIDHMCHDGRCVRPDHLRAVTNKQNGENRAGAYTTSKTGIRGVSRHSQNGNWVASVVHNYRKHHIGSFATIDEAEAAVVEARRRLFTHSDMDLP